MLDTIRAKRDQIYALARKHKAEKLWVFGSCARGEEHERSDVDFLVKYTPEASLFDDIRLERALSELLSRGVIWFHRQFCRARSDLPIEFAGRLCPYERSCGLPR